MSNTESDLDLDPSRGRFAESPRRIPRRGWKDVLLRVKGEVRKDNVSLIAAGMAFYAMLAVFPAVIAMVSIYGLIADPADVQEQIGNLAGVLPVEARSLIEAQLSDIVSSSSTSLGLGLVISLLAALWSASVGMKNAITGVNITYDEEERRGFLKLRALSLLLTLGAIVTVLTIFALVAVLPAMFGLLGLGRLGETLVTWGRWPLMAVLVMLGLGVLYRYAPCRNNPRWRWVSWGAVIATALWLGLTGLFSIYVSNFGSYNETYGALGSVIVLLLWFYVSSFVVLLGAELNSEIEHQTTIDSTVGDPEPMGDRGAVKADTIGRAFRPSEA